MNKNISISNHAIERAIDRNIIRGNRKSHFINGLKDLFKRSLEVVKLNNSDSDDTNKAFFVADQHFILVIKDNTLLTVIFDDQWRKKYKWKPFEFLSKEII